MVAETFTTEEKKQALELVRQSKTFARSDRLRGLLQFICQAEINGRQDSLNEYVIGVEALGRPEGYSPSEDSCVRSRIYELRQRLERFYATEAPDAPLRIDLPKGSYVPRYIRTISVPSEELSQVPSLPGPPSEPDLPQIPAGPPAPGRYLQWLIAFAAGAALMSAVSAVRGGPGGGNPARAANAGHQWTSDLESIWKPFLDLGTPVLVSFQSRLFLSLGNALVVRDAGIDSFAAVESSQTIMRTKALFGVPQLYENRNYTDFGAASACLLLGRLLGGRQPEIRAKRSSDVTWDDLGKHNVVVLGKPGSDPDIARLLPREHFVIDGAKIRNLRPQPGESVDWTDSGTPWDRSNNWSEKYGLVTMMPGPQSGRWILSLAGSGSEHLVALAEFLTSADSARKLVAKLRSPSGEVPSSWQAVLRADFKAQSPVKIDYVTHRILAGTPPAIQARETGSSSAGH